MDFVVLGSGTSVPHGARSSSGYWIETPAGSLLLDCSASAIHRMAQEGLDWPRLDAIWISHFHLDHCGGLAPFLFGTKYAPEMQRRTQPLTIFGAPGIRKLIENFDNAHNYRLMQQPFPIYITEVDTLEKFSILPDLEASTFSTPHTEESHAIHLTNGLGKAMVYSGDTGFSKPLAEFAKNCDLFVLECSFVKDKPVNTHLELAEAIFLVRFADPKRAVLTHFYPEWDAVDFSTEVSRFSPKCDVIEATDGLGISL
ncbi:MAG: ribonuclease Z [Pyrinomonadaceae bacterium]